MKRKPFKKSLLPTIEKLFLEKKTLQEVAEGLNVSATLLRRWLVENAELNELVQKIQELKITEALYRKAIGYDYTETRAEKIIIGKRQINTKTVMMNKHCPPDSTAAQLLLRKLNPQVWNDKMELNHTGQVDIVYDNVLLLDLPAKAITDERTIDIETTRSG